MPLMLIELIKYLKVNQDNLSTQTEKETDPPGYEQFLFDVRRNYIC